MEFVFFGASVFLFGFEGLEGSHCDLVVSGRLGGGNVWKGGLYFGGAKERLEGSQPRASAPPYGLDRPVDSHRLCDRPLLLSFILNTKTSTCSISYNSFS